MSCEARQEQVSLLIDGEAEEEGQATLFRHLGECSECRLFFDSMIRFRSAARRDREAIMRAADDVLPPRIAVPPVRRRSRERAGGWFRFLTGGWRLPAPAAVGLAIVLLTGGALVGARLARVSGGGQGTGAGVTGKPAVVVICGLPEVEVRGSGSGL